MTNESEVAPVSNSESSSVSESESEDDDKEDEVEAALKALMTKDGGNVATMLETRGKAMSIKTLDRMLRQKQLKNRPPA